MSSMSLRVIARVYTDFPDKFGVPRQSGRVEELRATLVFEPDYRDANALRGLEQFSHLWLIWQFSENAGAGWSPTVRPPKLGGNQRLGVFATRSPFRPNPLGLSAVRLIDIEYTLDKGPVLHLAGADLVSGTPIYDIKPYLASDSIPEAQGGFAKAHAEDFIPVDFPEELLAKVPLNKQKALLGVLREDPRPGYQQEGRQYGFFFAGMEIFFTVEQGILRVVDVQHINP